ncbi:MAG: ABC transporter substrate-binding protein [Methanomicrobiales archaeon]|jgi:NitT/TauT family transport system substrate-binding protein|nr:ABC transporter substrate-binding protein [Burkholderiaceae bacterium]NLH26317.1 ABC transporter substrate-binding protein [Methanomicrobiales archaeon]HNO07536.1 ABC transporter substrate-binding protein [Methanoregulaceae archaeon]
MIKRLIIALAVMLTALLIAGCITPSPSGENSVSVIYTKGTGPMPTLLATDQIDGYIAWQPFVEVAPLAGIGKVLVYSGDLPPAGRWKNHPCCVFTARQDAIDNTPELTNALTAAFVLSTQYISEHPNESAEIVADWLAGKGNFTYGNITVSSVDVLQRAFPTVKFVNEPTDEWKNDTLEFVYAQRELGVLTGALVNTTDAESLRLLFDTRPYESAQVMIQSGQITTPLTQSKPISVGYLLSDHDAALFVAVKNWKYFQDNYGIALKPRDLTASRPDIADLIVNGVTVAEVRLVPADAGPQLMQLASTDTIQYALVGNPPTIAAIDKGTPVKIIMALNNEGSGIVIAEDAPANDWDSFVTWAETRSAGGQPVKIAAPGKGSIQDVLLRYALEESGLSIKEG